MINAIEIMQDAQLGNDDNGFSITEVKMLWSEGCAEENKVFASLEDFSIFCRDIIALDDITPGTYRKTKFVLTFNDGNTYTGRIDVEENVWNVTNHILKSCTYNARFFMDRGEYDKAQGWIEIGTKIGEL